MKEKYNGLSKFQNEKRIKKQRQGNEKYIETDINILINEPRRVIAIMLDIGGTINGISNTKIKEFINLLNSIKIKYNATEVKICISTHDPVEDRIIALSQLLKPHLKQGFTLDKCFYLDGIYDPNKEETQQIAFHYNYQKLSVFHEHYLSYNFFADEKVVWFGIFDDDIDENHIHKYKNNCPMAIFKPSQIKTKEDNVMCYTTKTYGFDGVLELIRNYNHVLSKIGTKKLFEQQQNILSPLNYHRLIDMLKNNNYSLLLRYITETSIDETLYILLDKYLELIPDNEYTEELSMIKDTVFEKISKEQSMVKKI